MESSMKVADTMTQPRLTLEDYKVAYTLILLYNSGESKQHEKVSKIHSNHRELTDEDIIMLIVEDWYKSNPDPIGIFGNAFVAEQFSEPIKKQLTGSDVDPGVGRLMLGKSQVKERMLPLLDQSETPEEPEGVDVTVYGPNDREGHKMKFKMWKETPVLNSGWKAFVAKHGLEKHCHFLTIWMFRHKETREICFAIDFTWYPIPTLLPSKIFNSL